MNELPGSTSDAAPLVNEMTVAEVRKSLAHMRREWGRHSTVCPFFPAAQLPMRDMSISEFAFQFVMGHHAKRHHRQTDRAEQL